MTHAVVWLDEHQAQVIEFDELHSEPQLILAVGDAQPAYFEHITTAIAGAEAVLVTGTAAMAQAYADHVRDWSPALRARIVDVQPLGPQTDGALRAHAERCFRRADGPGRRVAEPA